MQVDILFNLYIARREDLVAACFTWHTTLIPVLIHHPGNGNSLSTNKFDPLKSGKLGGIRSLNDY